jgi:hypothetical protein
LVSELLFQFLSGAAQTASERQSFAADVDETVKKMLSSDVLPDDEQEEQYMH